MRLWILGFLGVVISVALILFTISYLNQKGTPPVGVSQSGSQSVATLSAPSGSPLPSEPGSSPLANASGTATAPAANIDLSIDNHGLSKAEAVMTTSQGVIKFKFYSNDAPKTVKRIVELIQKGFYDGLTFHRVVPGFVVQGGDPTGTGAGGSGQKLEAEFNGRHHVPGTLAMARAMDPNSADSQFYITLGTFPHLDNSYTVFGQVTEGLDIANRLKVGDKMEKIVVR